MPVEMIIAILTLQYNLARQKIARKYFSYRHMTVMYTHDDDNHNDINPMVHIQMQIQNTNTSGGFKYTGDSVVQIRTFY